MRLVFLIQNGPPYARVRPHSNMSKSEAILVYALKNCKKAGKKYKSEVNVSKLIAGHIKSYWEEVKSVKRDYIRLSIRIEASIGEKAIKDFSVQSLRKI